jgi:hypothetical protein
MPYKSKEDYKNWEKGYRNGYRQRPEVKQKLSEQSKLRRERNKNFVLEKMTPCISCGESDPVVIDFHHLDGSQKDKGISQMMNSSYSLNKIEEEISKCVCLCSNCHRKVHAGTLELRV